MEAKQAEVLLVVLPGRNTNTDPIIYPQQLKYYSRLCGSPPFQFWGKIYLGGVC